MSFLCQEGAFATAILWVAYFCRKRRHMSHQMKGKKMKIVGISVNGGYFCNIKTKTEKK